jgi:hypothetical protein
MNSEPEKEKDFGLSRILRAMADPAKRVETLRQVLPAAGIPIEAWGKGTAKTVEHLAREIEEGETWLERTPDGDLLRHVTVASAIVRHVADDGATYRLREEKQVFSDGRERVRPGQSISEKMKPNEPPDVAIRRAAKEELGVSGDVRATFVGTRDETGFPHSYPGLTSRTIWHDFEVTLDASQFRPEGYIERQKDKTTYFVWDKE